LITPEARTRKKADHVRFERARSMELWQMDIVGGAHTVDSPEAKVVTAVSDGPPVAAGTASAGDRKVRSLALSKGCPITGHLVTPRARAGNATPSPSPSSTGTSGLPNAAVARPALSARTSVG
jgi:hypothetical protein